MTIWNVERLYDAWEGTVYMGLIIVGLLGAAHCWGLA